MPIYTSTSCKHVFLSAHQSIACDQLDHRLKRMRGPFCLYTGLQLARVYTDLRCSSVPLAPSGSQKSSHSAP
eukprot:94927-Amphidinium_carterae.6